MSYLRPIINNYVESRKGRYGRGDSLEIPKGGEKILIGLSIYVIGFGTGAILTFIAMYFG